MAPWQASFQVVPHRVMAKAPRVLDAQAVASTEWWRTTSAASAAALRETLNALMGQTSRAGAGVEQWGTTEGNGVELRSAEKQLVQIVARVDVRKLDPRFGAALLGFVKSAQSVLVRSDGWVAEPTVGAFSAALRGDPAWTFAAEPATRIAAELREDDA